MGKYIDVKSVNVSKTPVTKSRKGVKRSRRIIASEPISAVHHYSTTGEDGEATHWIRHFFFDGTKYVHGPSYHTRNAKGDVASGQYSSMLPSDEYAELIGKAIEDGMIELPTKTIEFLMAKMRRPTNATDLEEQSSSARAESKLDEPPVRSLALNSEHPVGKR